MAVSPDRRRSIDRCFAFEALQPRILMTNDGQWLGINPSTEVPQSSMISMLHKLGVDVVRQGVSKTDFTTNAATIDAWVANGINPHVVIEPRSVRAGSNQAQWDANFQAYCVSIMSYYAGTVNYYIMGNEPNGTDPNTGGFTAQQVVDFSKDAFQAEQQVNASLGTSIKLESGETSGANLYTYPQQMFNAGLTQYCDYVGVHVYSNQILDGTLNLQWQFMQNASSSYGYPMKPMVSSESGEETDYAPSGSTPAQQRQFQTLWLDQWYVQMKRYGFSNGILFDYDGSSASNNADWGLIQDLSGNALPAQSEIQNYLNRAALQDGNFESTNDPSHEWVVYDPDLTTSLSLPVADYNFSAPGGVTGNCLSLNVGATATGSSLITRQVVDGVTPGVPITLTGDAFVSGSSTASIKAEGYSSTNGQLAVSASTNSQGAWKQLSVTVTPTNTWVVVELSATGTGVSGNTVKFDNVSISPTPLSPLNVSSGVYTVPAPATGAGIVPVAFSSVAVSQSATVVLADAASHADRNVLVTSSLQLEESNSAWVGTLDLGDNDLIVHNGNLTAITSQIRAGFSGGQWSGLGITSSAIASSKNHLYALGVIQNSTTGSPGGPALYSTFDGVAVVSTDVLVKYTYLGDANLDGRVDGSDYSRIDTAYLSRGTATPLSGWINGDFNFDGVVGGSDYTLIDNTFNSQSASLTAEIATPPRTSQPGLAVIDRGVPLSSETHEDDRRKALLSAWQQPVNAVLE